MTVKVHSCIYGGNIFLRLLSFLGGGVQHWDSVLSLSVLVLGTGGTNGGCGWLLWDAAAAYPMLILNLSEGGDTFYRLLSIILIHTELGGHLSSQESKTLPQP